MTLTQNQAASNVSLGNNNGTNGTLDLGANTLTIGNNLFYGWYGGASAVTRTTGSFTVPNLYVGNGNTLSLGSGDVVANLTQDGGSTLTTAATGNITDSATLNNASTLNLGAGLSLSNSLDVRNGSTVNMQSKNLSAGTVFLGWYSGAGNLTNRGNITTPNLYMANQNFDLNAGDAVTNFNVSNAATNLIASQSVQSLSLSNSATATTAATGNITGSATMMSGSTLTLGADLSLSGDLDVRDATLDAKGYNLNANTVFLGWYGGPATLSNPGTITTQNLYLGHGFNLGLGSGDVVANLTQDGGSTLTTAATGNITDSATLSNASTLNLGADLSLTGNLDVRSGSTVNTQGHAINADTAFIGYYDNGPANLTNAGAYSLNNLYVGQGSAVTLPGLNETIENVLFLSNGSTVTIAQADGVLTGLTFNGSSVNALSILDTSVLDFHFGLGVGDN